MPEECSGLLIRFDEERRNDLIEERAEGHAASFSEALSVRDWPVGELTVALLSFSSSTIDFIALAKRGKRIVTSKNRIEFSNVISLHSLRIAEIEARLKGQVHRYFIKTSQGAGGVIPPVTWRRLINAVKAERPELADEVDRILSLQRYFGVKLVGEPADVLLQEREAVGISLDIFSGGSQLRREVLREWAPAEGTVVQLDSEETSGAVARLKPVGRPFLHGVSHGRFQEESTIQHDLFNWPGMSAMHSAGRSTFRLGDRILDVMYANKNALEHTLGVDLIYYNERFHLFVLVQYKLMNSEGDNTLYRPDRQLEIELARMDEVHTLTKVSDPIGGHNDYRFNDDGFFFKLVPSVGLMPASGELIKGMYVPREYMHFLLGPAGPRGPQGGRQISFDNAPRYLTNSEFAANVNAGRLGTRNVTSDVLQSIIRGFYETGRAIVVSHETTIKFQPPQKLNRR